MNLILTRETRFSFRETTLLKIMFFLGCQGPPTYFGPLIYHTYEFTKTYGSGPGPFVTSQMAQIYLSGADSPLSEAKFCPSADKVQQRLNDFLQVDVKWGLNMLFCRQCSEFRDLEICFLFFLIINNRRLFHWSLGWKKKYLKLVK